MADKKTVVILSTYNGEKYIIQLLDSLRCQTCPDVFVYIRDDGSTDKTVDLIHACECGKGLDIVFERGSGHVGAAESFFKLLSRVTADREIEYICFCDQDDVWKKDKIARAVNGIQQVVNGIKHKDCQDMPVLYFSDYDLVNADLKFIKKVQPAPTPCRISFENAIVQNIVPGFTCAVNRRAALLLAENLPCSEKIVMHDWWVYLVVSAFGRIVHDPEPTVLYRRHENNTMDADTGSICFWQNRLKRFLKGKGHLKKIADQTEEFRRCFALKLDGEKKKNLDEFLNAVNGEFYKRVQYVFNGKTYYQAWFDNILFKLILVFEKTFKAMLP